MFFLPFKTGSEEVLSGWSKDTQHQGRERRGEGKAGLGNVAPGTFISPCSLLGGEPLDHVGAGASSSQKIPQWLLLERAILLLDLPITFSFFMLLNLFWNVRKERENFKLLFMRIKPMI